jgi:hypothetical protein
MGATKLAAPVAATTAQMPFLTSPGGG